jgi:hypothetical protein
MMPDTKKKPSKPSSVKPNPVVAEPAQKPTQLDRIEALLVELVESNRKLHPDISGLLNSGFKSNFSKGNS